MACNQSSNYTSHAMKCSSLQNLQDTSHIIQGAGALGMLHRREAVMTYLPTLLPKGTVWAFVWFPRQPSNIDFIILWWFAYCHSWELRSHRSPHGCRVLLLIMSAKCTWTDQEPQLGHFEIITLDLCLQSSWIGAGSCPWEDKKSRCTTVSTCRSLSSEIRQATNLFLLALACKRGFLQIRKLWFLVFICLICALTYSSFIFRNDCNCNML